MEFKTYLSSVSKYAVYVSSYFFSASSSSISFSVNASYAFNKLFLFDDIIIELIPSFVGFIIFVSVFDNLLKNVVI